MSYMSKVNLVKIASLCCLLLFGYVSQAHADSVTLGYSATGVGPLSFQADTFSLSGNSGSLTLNTASTTTQNINSATFFTGDSGEFSVTSQVPSEVAKSTGDEGVTVTNISSDGVIVQVAV